MLKRIVGAAAIAALCALPAGAQTTEAVPESAAAPEGAAAPESAAAPEGAGAANNPVLANVDGKDITAADIAFAASALGQALERVPAEQRPQMVLDLLIDMEILASAAKKAGLDQDPALERRVDYYRSQTLRDLYMEKLISEQVTEETVRARYETELANVEPVKEVSASHILVEDEATAKSLIETLNDGGDFAALAAEHSIDPGSKETGGSLGFFGPDQMVKPFEEAAFALEKGETTAEPVQSQFGYHIIRVDDTRERPMPTFEEVSDRIRQLMIREAFMNEVARLKTGAQIERLTPQQ